MFYGKDLRLRAIEREDIPRFLRWFNDPEVRQFVVMHEPLSRAKEEKWFEEHLSRADEIILAIEVLVEDEWTHIGNIGLHRIDLKNRTAVLGIVIGEKNFWGQGYGREAIRVLLRYAFFELGLNRVELETFEFNTRAIRCYEALGFKKVGVRRRAFFRDGKFHNLILMDLLAEEFDGPTDHKARKNSSTLTPA
ncbi:GNAT family N-acetyltransferase [Candidatus Bipolaricaulota bacterium]|nr:GNAT family N-acetyltransferase [Candidatus Bipolaricaulota bacterium]